MPTKELKSTAEHLPCEFAIPFLDFDDPTMPRFRGLAWLARITPLQQDALKQLSPDSDGRIIVPDPLALALLQENGQPVSGRSDFTLRAYLPSGRLPRRACCLAVTE